MAILFMYSFVAYLINSLRFSKVQFFAFQSPSQPIFRSKRKPKISESKMRWREESEKFSLSRLKLPQDDRTDTSFIAPLRIHFQRFESTLDKRKSVFNAFRRKPSLGAPAAYQATNNCTRTRRRSVVARAPINFYQYDELA